MGIPPIPESSREEFQQHASEFIGEAKGPYRLARSLLDEVERIGGEKVVIDGIRQQSTLRELKSLAGNLRAGPHRRSIATLFIHAAPDIAYRFYRRREATRITTAEFMGLYTAPVESEVPFLISDADAILYNWSGRTAYDRAVRDLMSAIRNEAQVWNSRGDSRFAHE